MKSFRVLMGVIATVALAACGSDNVGSKYLKSEKVDNTRGAVIEVSATDSATLAGTRLELPAGVLKATTTITLEVGMVDLVAATDVGGPVAKWGPDGTKFNAPVKMTMPFTTARSNDLSILVKEANGTSFRIPHSGLTIDSAKKLVSFQVTGFTSFQPSTAPVCRQDSDCAAGQVCQNAVCVAADAGGTGGGGGGNTGGGSGGGGGIDGGLVCTTNLDCPTGDICVGGRCGPGGAGGGGGTGGGVGGGGTGGGGAIDAGQCCVTTRDCAAGQLCIGGSCQQGGTGGGAGGGSGVDGGTGGGVGGGSGVDGGTGGGAGGGSGNFCRSDLECSTNEVCINNSCQGIPVSDGGSGGGAGGGSGSDGGTGGGAGGGGPVDGGGGTGGGAGGGAGGGGGASDGGSADAGPSCTNSSQCAMPEVCYQSTCQAISCSVRPCPGTLTCVNTWCQ